eukprot:14561474-Ditylum_brightwellii.AAC.1
MPVIFIPNNEKLPLIPNNQFEQSLPTYFHCLGLLSHLSKEFEMPSTCYQTQDIHYKPADE